MDEAPEPSRFMVEHCAEREAEAEPRYLPPGEMVQVGGPQSQQLHVDAYLRHVAEIDAENQRLIEQFTREFSALAEQRRLDEMEL